MAKETPASIRLRTTPCPECSSSHVFREVSARHKSLGLYCFACKHRWPEVESKRKK